MILHCGRAVSGVMVRSSMIITITRLLEISVSIASTRISASRESLWISESPPIVHEQTSIRQILRGGNCSITARYTWARITVTTTKRIEEAVHEPVDQGLLPGEWQRYSRWVAVAGWQRAVGKVPLQYPGCRAPLGRTLEFLHYLQLHMP